MLMVAATIFTSCNQDDNDDDNNNTLPDLTASLSVTGAVSADYSFMNPENGGSNAEHSMLASYTGATDGFAISGINTDYSYSIGGTAQAVQTGTIAITSASYGHLVGPVQGFDNLIGGNININSSQFLYTAGVTTVYSISGNWSVEIADDETPPGTITFTGSFTNLVVSAVN